jgi:pyruvate kinase
MKRRAKIVATIGPACSDEETIRNLLKAGMDVARLNFSHGTHPQHANVFKKLHQAARDLELPITILQDLQGPKIRTGQLENGQVELAAGQPLTLTTEPILGNEHIVPVDFPELIPSAKTGGRILLDDGNLELAIIGVKGNRVETRVVVGGVLKPHKGVNLPGADLDIPGFTEKDREDLVFGLDLGVDAIAVSFVRSEKDIQSVRQAIQELDPSHNNLPIIAKLERPQALNNLEAIVAEADGVMVARGDLGVELSAEFVPIAQKEIIAAANRQAKVVITATQMLESMIQNPRPTRAEASDVANAIFDGSDAVMLSGETATGKYPVQSVETMNAIVLQAEAHIQEWGHWQGLKPGKDQEDDAFYLTQAARELAHDRNVAAIAVFTKSGRTALLMSKARPEVPILAFTPERKTYSKLNLYWGVSPNLVPHTDTIEAMLEVVEASMLASSDIQSGQQVVLICGFPVHAVRPTNLALLHTVGSASHKV